MINIDSANVPYVQVQNCFQFVYRRVLKQGQMCHTVKYIKQAGGGHVRFKSDVIINFGGSQQNYEMPLLREIISRKRHV